MVRMVLHEWAYETDSDEFVHISDAIPSKPYRCTKKDCGLEIRRRAGTMEPHFYHLNPEGDISCEGGEGPRHLYAKNKIAQYCESVERVQVVRIEQRVARFVVDIFIQTDFGPFYIEVIDSHAPEELKWTELKGRIIPIWINHFEDSTLRDGFMLEHDFYETMRSHFHMITNKVNKFSLMHGLTLDQSWYRHMNGIFMEVQDNHRQARGHMESLYTSADEYHHEIEEFIEAYKAAARRLWKENN